MGRKKKVLTADENVLVSRGFKHYKNGIWTKSTAKMTTDEWLGERQFGLGGSDIGTILGFNTFKTAVELFREKVGLNDAPKLETMHIYWGHEGENAILHVGQHYDFSVDTPIGKWGNAWVDNLYAGAKLRTITKFENMCVNINIPWLQANVDGLENHNKRVRMATMVAEAKNTQSMVCKSYNDWVNPSYIAQGLTYAKVLQPMLLAPGFKIFQKLDGNDLMARIYTVSDFEWLVDDILNESFDFYNKMQKGIEVVNNATDKRQAILGLRPIEPGPDNTERYNKFISLEYFENLKFTTADLTNLGKHNDDDVITIGWFKAIGDGDPEEINVPYKDVKNIAAYVAQDSSLTNNCM